MSALKVCRCRHRAEMNRAAWMQGRSVAVAAVAQTVSVGDRLGIRADDASNGIRELRDSEREGGESRRSLSEFALRKPCGVHRLEGVALGMHEQIDLGSGVVGGSHADEPTDGEGES